MGPDNLTVILEIVEQMSAFVEAPDKLFGWVQDKIKEVGELDLDELWSDILKTSGVELAKIAAKALITEVLPLVFPAGAALKFVQTAWRGLNWVLEQKAKLEKLFGGVREAFNEVLDGGGADRVQRKVYDTLRGLVAPLLDLQAKLFGLGDIPRGGRALTPSPPAPTARSVGTASRRSPRARGTARRRGRFSGPAAEP